MRFPHPFVDRDSGQAPRPRRHPRDAAIVLGALLSAAWAGPARAEGPDSAGAQAEASGSSSPSAEELGAQAYAAYSSGKFTEAISKYLAVYESFGSPAALLNVATIYDRNLHEPEIASEYYRRYLRAPNADSQRIEKVNERLLALKRETAQAAQTPAPESKAPESPAAPAAPPSSAQHAPPPAASAEPRRSGGTGRVVGAVSVGVGLASLGASGVLSLLARKKNNDADAYCTGNVCHDARGVQLADQAGDFATGATIAFTSGAVLVGTGITIYLLSSSSTGSEQPKTAALSISPVVGPIGSGINLGGSF